MKDNNVLYPETKEIPCGRCKSNDSELLCTNCDPQFKYCCLNCHNIIHSLPSKKNHKRTSVANLEPPLSYKFNNDKSQSVNNDDNRDKNSELNQSNKFQQQQNNNYMQSISPIRPSQFQANNNVFNSLQTNNVIFY